MVRQSLKEYHLRKSFTYFSITHRLVTINISGCASNEFSCPRGAPRCVAQSSRFCFSKKAKQTTLLNLMKYCIASSSYPKKLFCLRCDGKVDCEDGEDERDCKVRLSQEDFLGHFDTSYHIIQYMSFYIYDYLIYN